ncbi:portal protein [Vibrio phage 1.111.B._10N.286.45.E6]|nr:portal protein [Vibrio phage 1.111.A._10N.286.45.E6]AUR88270.1 portal protein [Vibrio phage 1.111.B._10N.286.45.E6]
MKFSKLAFWRRENQPSPNLTTVKNKLDSGTSSSRGEVLYRSVENVNEDIKGSLSKARARSYGAALNSPLVGEGVDTWVSDEIGSRCSIVPMSANESANKSMAELFKKHERFLDVNEEMKLAAILSVAARERRTAGEVFIRLIRRRVGAYPVPMQVQVIGANQCPMELNETRPNGNVIRQGIEYSKNKKVAVWLKKSQFENVRVPIGDIIHSKLVKYAGLNRGIPSTVRGLLKEGEYNSYQENELNRKAAQSSVIGMITDENEIDEMPRIEGDYTPPAESQGIEQFNYGPNTLLKGAPGQSLTMNNSPDTGQNYKDFSGVNERYIGSGLGIPHQLITSNYEGINDRTLRQINNSYRRKVRSEREFCTVDQVVSKLWRWFVDAAVLSGLDLPDYWEKRDDYREFRFSAEAHAYDHAVQDLQAAERAITLGVKSPQSFCEERGESYNQILEDKAAHIKKVLELASKYNINPSYLGVAESGI